MPAYVSAFSLPPFPVYALLNAYSLPIHCLFTAYSLPMHCLFTAYSLPMHCLFTAYYLAVRPMKEARVMPSSVVQRSLLRLSGLPYATHDNHQTHSSLSCLLSSLCFFLTVDWRPHNAQYHLVIEKQRAVNRQ